jgi:dephospho-CoA kinase
MMDTKLQIIGVGGSNGAGKDSVGQILADEYGYIFISVTDLLRAEATKRREPVEREVLRSISAEWRRESGLGVLVEKAMSEYKLVKDKYAGVVMASMRNPGEADKIHELGGTMLWVDANPRTRYDRIQANAATRNRIEEDSKTFDQFLAEEEAEMHTTGDAATLDMAAVKDRCDLFIINDSNDLGQLQADIEKTLELPR